MALKFSTVPSNAKQPLSPFTVSVSDEQIEEFRTLVRLSKIAPPTYEGSQEDRRLGLPTAWLANAKEELQRFDWREAEKHINGFPQFTREIEGLTVHFVALFSEKEDAKPIVFLHGWPGSFLEFLPLLSLFSDKYEPNTLPYHLIVPSLPGYAFSSGPPVDKDFNGKDIARVVNKLMIDLGFGAGYIAQGGDVGSRVGRNLGLYHDSCKAVHLNFLGLGKAPPQAKEEKLSAVQEQGAKRREWFGIYGTGYYYMHATRPSTIGHILSTNPVALLTWLGEKFLDWPDNDYPIPLQTILKEVALYWFTETFPRSIYTYRELYPPPALHPSVTPEGYIHKPFGFSYFPQEIMPSPRSWVEATGNLVFWKEHEKGGHFAALERPQDIADDIVEFVEQVWPTL
ncbi:putative epoxide hydrolase [Talaromyces proteolyticus]|uniref:Epoxide hydrolase n=1 Tax=Talaromyces proteolyticus TaxID=1131652 RepID=A0AAD4KZI5_9EURO|nr:putative epoxide hydrolase [Talaromyces proteolyticus]KAH8704777.1 putative epoxide hydrolase [Talaromyces proteolyticus]